MSDKTTIRDLKRAVKAAGATLDESTVRAGFVNVDAPDGFVWGASSTHALCVWFSDAGSSYGDRPDPAMLHEAIVDVVERMAYGTVECTDPECDICHPEAET